MALRTLSASSGGMLVILWSVRACSESFCMISSSLFPRATKSQSAPTSLQLTVFAISPPTAKESNTIIGDEFRASERHSIQTKNAPQRSTFGLVQRPIDRPLAFARKLFEVGIGIDRNRVARNTKHLGVPAGIAEGHVGGKTDDFKYHFR